MSRLLSCVPCFSLSFARLNRVDFELCVRLAMTALPVRIFPPLFLERHDLVAATMFNDLCLDGGAGDQRRSGSWRVATQKQDLRKSERFTHFALEPLDGNDLVLGNPILLSAAADDREHLKHP